MAPPQPALIARDLYKGFGAGRRSFTILHGVSMEVARGETVFLVGPSGSGKTTLLSILGCILSADQGTLQALGRLTKDMKPSAQAAFRRQHFGFIFQTFNLFPTLSARDNVRLGLTMTGLSLAAAGHRADAVLDRVGLAERAHHRPGLLSTGECQRVAIARALANNPALLFADEPTASLDAENGQSVMELISQLVRENGTTLVVVTHDQRIYKFADRILQLENGRLTDTVGSVSQEWPVMGRAAEQTPLLENGYVT